VRWPFQQPAFVEGAACLKAALSGAASLVTGRPDGGVPRRAGLSSARLLEGAACLKASIRGAAQRGATKVTAVSNASAMPRGLQAANSRRRRREVGAQRGRGNAHSCRTLLPRLRTSRGEGRLRQWSWIRQMISRPLVARTTGLAGLYRPHKVLVHHSSSCHPRARPGCSDRTPRASQVSPVVTEPADSYDHEFVRRYSWFARHPTTGIRGREAPTKRLLRLVQPGNQSASARQGCPRPSSWLHSDWARSALASGPTSRGCRPSSTPASRLRCPSRSG
jgi:hypothetical protein